MIWTRDEMAARELKDGYYVNLGTGIPTPVANNMPAGMTMTLQSENGMLGKGPFPYNDEVDTDLINVGKQVVDMIITDIAVFQGVGRRSPFDLVEAAPPFPGQNVAAKPTAHFRVSAHRFGG